MVTIDGKEIINVFDIQMYEEADFIEISVWHDKTMDKSNNLDDLGYQYTYYPGESRGLGHAEIRLPLKTEVHFKSVEATS